MLYYGDRRRDVAPRAVAAAVGAGLARERPTLEMVRAAYLESAALAQGLADLAFEERGEDGPDGAGDAALALTREVARRLLASWDGRSVKGGEPEELGALLACRLPPRLAVKEPEGYAHYALYPETCALAARRLPRDAPWAVVGIRSIGAGLGAMAAAALDAILLVTVRPTGHPFARALRLSAELRARIAGVAAQGARFAVVDEGPGLSGSSFLAVARALEALGVASERVTFLPSHGGEPGSAAHDAGRVRWRRADRQVVDFDDAILPRLRSALTERTGAFELLDVSGGGWREHACGEPARWPAVFKQQERRKYLARAGRETWHARFAGLGRIGEEKLALARALAEAGFAPEVLGLVEGGFLVERWVDGEPFAALDEEELVGWLARYLSFRARAFPAEAGAGAERLLELLRVNVGESLGEAAVEVERFRTGASEAAALPRVLIDGKLERWEWRVDARGRLVKTDAVDHARGHDLVGAQPIAWDVAGAAVELGLSAAAMEELQGRVAAGASEGALAFFRAAYLAHRLGRWTFALQTESDPVERGRIERELARYGRMLAEVLRAR